MNNLSQNNSVTKVETYFFSCMDILWYSHSLSYVHSWLFSLQINLALKIFVEPKYWFHSQPPLPNSRLQAIWYCCSPRHILRGKFLFGKKKWISIAPNWSLHLFFHSCVKQLLKANWQDVGILADCYVKKRAVRPQILISSWQSIHRYPKSSIWGSASQASLAESSSRFSRFCITWGV